MTTTDTIGDDIWTEIVNLHNRLDLRPLNELGVWRLELPDGWYMAVNGTSEPQTVEPDGGMGFDVAPYHAAFWFNGWLAGEVHPVAGGLLAAGDAANAESLLAALREGG